MIQTNPYTPAAWSVGRIAGYLPPESFGYKRGQIRLELHAELRPMQGGSRLTVDHLPRPDDALELSITGDIKHGRYDLGGGQCIDTLRQIAARGRPWAAEVADLWERWHLNGMRAECAHQGRGWTCTNNAAHHPMPLPPGIHTSGPVDVPRYLDCPVCKRARWDEPGDWCPVTGYRAGTSWLYEPIPAAVLDRLRVLFAPIPPEGYTYTPPVD